MSHKPHFVLILRDEERLLYLPATGRMESDETAIDAALSHDPSRPVSLMLDFSDQHFEQVSLPGGNILDRRKILARKRQAIFGNTITHGVVNRGQRRFVLTGSRSADGRLASALAALTATGNPVSGIALLPVEIASWLKAEFIQPSHSPWCMAMLQCPRLGFRQLVLAKGRIVFARSLRPVLSPEALARETQAAFTYLPRLGLLRHEKITLVSSLDFAPITPESFAGYQVDGLHFLPGMDYALDFARWAAGKRHPSLPIRQRDLTLDRASRICLRASFTAVALIALGGFGYLTHQHRQAIALAAAITEAGLEQQHLLDNIVQDNTPGSQHGTMRAVLATSAGFTDTSLLADVKHRLTEAAKPLPLDRFQFMREPTAIRLSIPGDREATRKLLQPLLPGHSLSLVDGGVEIR